MGPDLWVHDYTHAPVDYVVGDTRIVCNPRGHADDAGGFNAGKTIAVSRPASLP